VGLDLEAGRLLSRLVGRGLIARSPNGMFANPA